MISPRCLPAAQLQRDLGFAAVGAVVGLLLSRSSKKTSTSLAIIGGSLAGLAYAAYDSATTCTENSEPAGDTP